METAITYSGQIEFLLERKEAALAQARQQAQTAPVTPAPLVGPV